MPLALTAGGGCDPGGKGHVLEVFAELINTWDPLLSLRAHLQLLPIQASPFPSSFTFLNTRINFSSYMSCNLPKNKPLKLGALQMHQLREKGL